MVAVRPIFPVLVLILCVEVSSGPFMCFWFEFVGVEVSSGPPCVLGSLRVTEASSHPSRVLSVSRSVGKRFRLTLLLVW